MCNLKSATKCLGYFTGWNWRYTAFGQESVVACPKSQLSKTKIENIHYRCNIITLWWQEKMGVICVIGWHRLTCICSVVAMLWSDECFVKHNCLCVITKLGPAYWLMILMLYSFRIRCRSAGKWRLHILVCLLGINKSHWEFLSFLFYSKLVNPVEYWLQIVKFWWRNKQKDQYYWSDHNNLLVWVMECTCNCA